MRQQGAPRFESRKVDGLSRTALEPLQRLDSKGVGDIGPYLVASARVATEVLDGFERLDLGSASVIMPGMSISFAAGSLTSDQLPAE